MTDTGVDGDRRRITVVGGIICLIVSVISVIHAVAVVGSDAVNVGALAQAVGVADRSAKALEFSFVGAAFRRLNLFSIGVADCEHRRAAGNRCAHASLKGIAFDGVLIAEIAAERIERVRVASVSRFAGLIVADHIVEVLAAQEDLGDFKVIGSAQRNRKTVIQIGVFLGESAGPVVAVDDCGEIEAGGLVSGALPSVASRFSSCLVFVSNEY